MAGCGTLTGIGGGEDENENENENENGNENEEEDAEDDTKLLMMLNERMLSMMVMNPNYLELDVNEIHVVNRKFATGSVPAMNQNQ